MIIFNVIIAPKYIFWGGFFMKLKKLSHVLVFCFGLILMFFAIDLVFDFLENKMFPEKPNGFLYFAETIERVVKSIIGILILSKLGKTNILKDKGKGFWRGVLLGSVILFIGIYNALKAVLYMLGQESELQPMYITIAIVCMFFMVGVFEEIMHRGIILGVLDDYFGHKSAGDVWKTVILLGIFFGIFHLENLNEGVGLLPVLNQAVGCVGAGIFFGAVYMRCRNLYSVIFIHAISDTFSALWLFVAGTSLWDVLSSSKVDFLNTFVMLIIHVLLAMFLLRKKKMAEIIDSEPNKLSLDPKYN